MKTLKHTLATAVLGVTLAGCASTTGPTGPTVISYDHGALDTLLELGLEERVLAIPHQGLPDYLSELGSRLPDAGSLKVPDLEVLEKLQPELVLMTGRQGDAVDDVRKLARVMQVGVTGDSFRDAVSAGVLELAEVYGLQKAATEELAELWQHVDARQAQVADAGTVTVVTHNDGNLSLRQEAVVYELLNLAPETVPASVQPVVRGERTFYPVDADTLVAMAPETLLVVDRSAAIGGEPLEPDTLESAFRKAGAATRVVVLDPGLWYLSGGGLQSVRLQVDEVVNAVQ
ncbi:MAG TPA: ABC transporter substrate-binding protein [Marinobacter sp.]|nr:ABC transporter substrate-binding protein [Marinobacter sp.]